MLSVVIPRARWVYVLDEPGDTGSHVHAIKVRVAQRVIAMCFCGVARRYRMLHGAEVNPIASNSEAVGVHRKKRRLSTVNGIFRVPAGVPSICHRLAPIDPPVREFLRRKYPIPDRTLMLSMISGAAIEFGKEEIRTVPAAVPSLDQSCVPWIGSLPRKISRLPSTRGGRACAPRLVMTPFA